MKTFSSFIPCILKWMWLSVASHLKISPMLYCPLLHIWPQATGVLSSPTVSWLIFGCAMLNLIRFMVQYFLQKSEKCFLLKAPDISSVTLRRDSVTWSRTQIHFPDGSEQLRSRHSNMTTPLTHQVSLWYLKDPFWITHMDKIVGILWLMKEKLTK